MSAQVLPPLEALDSEEVLNREKKHGYAGFPIEEYKRSFGVRERCRYLQKTALLERCFARFSVSIKFIVERKYYQLSGRNGLYG